MIRPAAPLLALVVAVIAGIVACGGGPSPSATPPSRAGSPSGSPDAAGSPSAAVPPSGTPSLSATARPSETRVPVPASVEPPAPTARPTLRPTPRPTDPPPVSNFPQAWAGSWEDPGTGGAGSLELLLTGQDADFGGSITMDGTACLASGLIAGSYDGRNIAFTVSQRGTTVEFEGVADPLGMTGTFNSECDGLNGTWTVQRTSR